ncbi:unnamed protein product [Leptidea sinapis]|uniref:Progestin and adipoQ receptor family member 4 n=1 Tax=Leptidea sinapis TaxID=189913 RepID=A0A5E4QBZ8_9NEOP|nr:unnamed protein product [Leptidea sinapis]
MLDNSMQELNGSGPKKRRNSAENICDKDENVHISQDLKKNDEVKIHDAAPDRVELLHWRDMPKHLQFNPYVLTGYRPLQDVSGCIRSLFYFHNETINILTHGVSLVFMIAVLPGLLPWSVGGWSWFLSLCHLLGALAPWCGSFLYHLFMNHTRGAGLYHRLLQLDMLGIWVSQSIGE